MSKLVSNYTANGSSTTDEYGTFVTQNRMMVGDVIQGFNVVANATPGMNVYVQPGSGRISTGTSPNNYGYLIAHDTALPGENVTISTAAASARIDYIVAYIDKSVAGSTSGANVNNTNNVLKFAAVAGTPSGSPAVPTVSQIQTAIGAANPYIILAQIAVGANVTQITNSNITDLRTFVMDLNDAALGQSSYIDSDLVWSATSGLNGAMTAGKAYINVNGVMVPVSLAAISSRAFTASKDTYVAVDVNGTITYNEVANNASAPTQPNNAVWLAVVTTSGSAITLVNTTAIDSNGKLIRPCGLGTKQTDANGWLVLERGATRDWYKRVTVSSYAVSSGGTGVNLPLSSSTLPVGFATLGTVRMKSTNVFAQDGGLYIINPEMTSSSTALKYTVRNEYTATLNLTCYIDIILSSN